MEFLCRRGLAGFIAACAREAAPSLLIDKTTTAGDGNILMLRELGAGGMNPKERSPDCTASSCPKDSHADSGAGLADNCGRAVEWLPRPESKSSKRRGEALVRPGK